MISVQARSGPGEPPRPGGGRRPPWHRAWRTLWSRARRTLWSRASRTLWRPLVAWAAIAPFAAYAAARLVGVTHGWLLVAGLAFTPYVAAATLLPLVITAVTRQWVATGVAALVAAALAACVLPRAIGAPEPVSGRPALRVATANMQYGEADPGSLTALVRDHAVDLLALQEYTPEAERALDAAGIGTLLRYRVAYPLDAVGGSALYSRYPLTDGAYRPLPGDFGQASATLHVPGAPPVLVESVHPCAPAGRDLIPHWRSGLASEPRATPHGPVRLLLGDFNSTLDHAPLQRLLDSGYRDAASVVGQGLLPSWPFDGTRLPKVTIDHVLADPRIRVRAVAGYPNPGSDHRAIFASLALPSA